MLLLVDNIDVMMHEEFKDSSFNISKDMTNIIFITICLILMPVVMIRNFNRIKFFGVMIMILNIGIIL